MLETLVYCEAQIFANQRYVNVLLVGLDYRIQIFSSFDFVEIVHRRDYTAGPIRNPARMAVYAVSKVQERADSTGL